MIPNAKPIGHLWYTCHLMKHDLKVVVAIDSFKGSLSSMEAGAAAATGIRLACPGARVVVRPLADGGEGTVDALVAGFGGSRRCVTVTGPAERPVECHYGVLGDASDGSGPPVRTCILEMAGAAGITLVSDSERNPLLTTTFGVGEAIRDAVMNGCRRFIVGIGGSATNDGGAGMLQALGFGLLDRNGNPIAHGGAALASLACITTDDVLPELKDCRFRVACDVTNPLCGPTGASIVFGPQKGATPEMVGILDAALRNFAEVTARGDAHDSADYPGDGAAGGLGFAFRRFLNAELVRGVELVLSETGLEDDIRETDVVVTGEGRLDAQTVMGKAPVGVAALAKRHGKPVIALSGCVAGNAGVVNAHGIDAFFPIAPGACTLSEALDRNNAMANLTRTAEQAFRLLVLGMEARR